MNWSTNRVVAVLTPVFAAAAAVGSAWLTKHFPGLPELTSTDTTILGGLVAVSATAAALKWLHGHQSYEKIIAEAAELERELAAKK
jgi:hypothetical protein